MNTILRRTHIKANIDILKARDYYFNIAKTANLLKTLIALLPPLLMAITYVLDYPLFSGDLEELIIGAITTVVAFAVYLIDLFIQKYTTISNQLRGLYDHKVLGTKYNPHMYQAKDVSKYLKNAEKVKHITKYEVWYSEVFSENEYANVFCCQLDNLIYSKHAYRQAKLYYSVILALFSVLVIAAISFSVIEKRFLTAILIVFTILECYDVIFSKISALNEGLDICCDLVDFAKNLSPEDVDKTVVEQAQEVVNKNRELCIFLPPIIRNRFLEDDNPFYRELNDYKNKFMGENAVAPESADDIEIVFEDGSDAIPLRQIQNRLSSMLKEVVTVLDENKIDYMLDGGTLIGAMRKTTQGFIPWDDDIDITIPIHQVEAAKSVLRERLDYFIQDAENEPFYSPRLSCFKIRETNEQSRIAEKDSLLYKEYQNNGIFIDVYAFSPVLLSKTVDKLFRHLVIHPMNRKLEKIENNYPPRGSKEKQCKMFAKAKKRYLGVLSFYQKYAKNTRWYAYFPGYIYDHASAGPYHAATDLYQANHNYALWETENYRVPAMPDAVLRSYYGKDWETPPFASKAELIKKHGSMWFSKAPTNISAAKHIMNIISFRR